MRQVCLIDSNKQNIDAAQKAISKSHINLELNTFASVAEFANFFKDNSKANYSSLFINTNKSGFGELNDSLKNLSQELNRFLPVVFISKTDPIEAQLVNTMGVINVPFSGKIFMEMLYSIRMYWDNFNTVN